MYYTHTNNSKCQVYLSPLPRTEGREEPHTPRRHSPSVFPPLSTPSRNPHPAFQDGDPASERRYYECTNMPAVEVENPAIWFRKAAGVFRRFDCLLVIIHKRYIVFYVGNKRKLTYSCVSVCLSRNWPNAAVSRVCKRCSSATSGDI